MTLPETPDVISSADDWSVWLVAVVAGLGAIGWLARKAHRGVRAAREFAARVDKVLDLADHQLNNNGGGSLLDYVQQTHALATRTASDLDAMTTVVDGIADAQDALTEQFVQPPAN